MRRIRLGYCLDCDWTASTTTYSREELSSLLLDHALESGHNVDTITLDKCPDSSLPTTDQTIEPTLN